ncbi:MAG: hypothetical protein IH936_08335 [Acidobacteria bacterium]|nr:hypothetical protein [Acidobacteriota bacterium]
MRVPIALCLLLGGIAAVVFYRVQGFFPSHAVLVGLAVGALVYTLLRVFDNLRLASRTSRGRVPRNQQERQDK